MSSLKKVSVAICATGAIMALPAATASASSGSAVRAAKAEPKLITPPGKLAAALHCSGNLRTGKTEPVLLVHGTSATGREAWVAPIDLAAILRSRGFATCYVDLPEDSLGDIQTSAEYVVAAVRTMSARAKRPIAMYGHSQGGLLMRWALTYWPSLRRQVADAVTASGSHHGTTGGRLASVLTALCAGRGCPPAFLQQMLTSNLMGALNNGRDETPGPTAWTTIRTSGDDIVQPVSGAALKGATNVLIQSVCPGRQANHDDARYDSVSFAALVDALRRSGPAKTSRLSKRVCDTPYAPGVKVAAVKAAEERASKDSVERTLGYQPSTTKEPAVRAYARVQAQAQAPEDRAAKLVGQMTVDEKLDLVSSGLKGVPRLGIPPLVFRDGPHGIGLGTKGVTSFPASVALGSTWDLSLANRLGTALATELRAKGVNGLFGPTVEPLRNPLWGRAPETYGEDPLLNAQLATREVRGVQSAHVLAQVKHFAANTQEYGRFGLPLTGPGTNSQVSLRALQEIYFPPFKAAIQQGKAASAMCSYQQLNGTPSCQNPQTLGMLKGWGLRGFVGPDAIFAVRNVAAAANAGVDNFQLQSFPPGAERSSLASSVGQARIDDAATRILIGMTQTGAIDAGVPVEKPVASTSAHRALATQIAAEGSVLLKNARIRGGGRSVLPLTKSDRSIAVIGYDAGKATQTQEGGSPAVAGRTPIAPLDAIRRIAPSGTKVTYAPGTRGVVPLPVVPTGVLTPASGSGTGLSGAFFADRAPTFAGTPTATRVDPTISFDTSTDSNTTQPLEAIPNTGGAGSGRWTGTLTPPKTGRYRFSLTFAGNAKLFIDGRRVIGGDTEFVQGGAAGYPGAPDISYHGVVDLTAGEAVPIRVEYATSASIGGAVLELGWQPPEPRLRQAAVDAARKADRAVVFVNDISAEGMDRTSLGLPGDQDDLIRAVAEVNPNTVVVLHTASAVAMPWKDRVAGIVEAWYPGQQSGEAIAKVLLGRTAPAGRLPITFPASDTKNPAVEPPSDVTGADNVRPFGEGLMVGYRYYDAANEKPLFPFGFGLTYTTFKMCGLSVRRHGSGATVRVRVKNTGRRTGSDVVQVYLGFPTGSGEPPRQLKAFRKVTLKPRRAITVTLPLNAASFQVFNESSNAWVTPKGHFSVRVGSSSRDLPLRGAIDIG